MIRNPQIDAFFERLAAANVQHRCNWQAKRSPDLKGYDIEHLSFRGDGFSPSEATAVLISYGKDGYGLYFDSGSASIADDVARIAKPRAKETVDARELAETLRLMHQHYGTLHDLVSDLMECGALVDEPIANKLEECSTVADRAQRVLAARVATEAADKPALALLKSALADWPQFDVPTVLPLPGGIPEELKEAGEVNGGDMVEWFGEFREKAKAIIASATTDFTKVGNTLANVARYDAALNEAEIAPNGDDYNTILGLLNGVEYSAPRKEGR
ncbi:hypothetical protein [Mesorhizobium silamurunense]|uniref:hypothetical protein n=1 Tax=Mesorhizobium silamurunense TaxID=499528 RepID=UPI0017819232|nr:hypothetical protein [Mesorhizobium silamurunense]